jgi:localization factor PodJL
VRNSYRPQDLPLADAGGAETSVPGLNAPSPLASNFQLADPVITGSISKTQAPLDPPPEAIGSPRLRASALAGDPAAEFEIAMRLAEGRGVARDPAKAAAWFERAASQGLVPAQYRLGSMTEKGLGRPKDLNAARELYEQAAGRGNVQAMHNLGVLHAEGGLGAPDMATALAWFQEAAAHGVKDSQFNLGVIYTRGLASPQDLPEAYLWFALAAQQGDKDATGKRDQIAAKLKAQELETAKKMVADWKAQPVDRTANEVAGPPGGWDDPVTGRASAAENTRIR